jgi:hypothetical protein
MAGKALVLILIGALAVAGVVDHALAATICQWTDGSGRTHYGDPRRAGENCQVVDPAHLPAVNGQQAIAIKTSPPTAARRTVRRRAIAPRVSRKHDCQAYRDRISGIEYRLRQGYTEPTGSRLRAQKRRWTETLYRHCY